MSTTSWAGKDAGAQPISFAAEQPNPNGPLTPHSVPEIGGAVVSVANPMPVRIRFPATPIASSQMESAHRLCAAPCSVLSLNLNAVQTGWFMLLDLPSIPIDGAVAPVKAWQAQLWKTIDVTFDPPLAMTNGAIVVFTTDQTPFVLTSSPVAMISGEIG